MAYAKVLSFLIWAVISLWSRLIRMRHVNRDVPEGLRAGGKSFIYAFWHGRLFLLPHTYRNSGIVIPVSESRDGEVLAQVLKRFRLDTVRGSSKRKGDRALRGMIQSLREGKVVAVAVDGPRGPAFKAKDGVVYLAGKLNVPIVPAATGARRFRILEKTWEKLLVPLPFTQGLIVYGEPIVVNGTSPDELEAKRGELEKALNSLMQKADTYFTRPSHAVARNEQRQVRSVFRPAGGPVLPEKTIGALKAGLQRLAPRGLTERTKQHVWGEGMRFWQDRSNVTGREKREQG